MGISLHLRAVSLEYCRKRQVVDFQRKFSELAGNAETWSTLQKDADALDTFCSCFKKVYLGSIFNLIFGSDVDSIEYICIPFSRNLQVSCCGTFNELDTFDSTIGFNLISFVGMSILVLTTFKVVKHYLDSFLARYDFPHNAEKLVNDIAFVKCEEPLIAPQLWRSLSEDEKLAVRLSLRPPAVRAEATAPRIIRLTPNDFVRTVTEMPDFIIQAFVPN